MKKMITAIFCLILVITPASAHPGRTDANGGHWDHSTGEFHYHHGYPAHQHTNGVCPYDYDDQTGATSGSPSSGSSSNAVAATADPSADEAGISSSTTSESADNHLESAPDGYPNAVNYNIVAGSQLIDRTYYFDENGFMYTPFPYDDIPHGEVETDNTQYLQYDSVTVNQVVYQYGLENQSEQFQQGATFGIHEASLYYDQWYEEGYADGQQTQSEPVENETLTSAEYDEIYYSGYEDGEKYGENAGYSSGYTSAETKYQWIIIIGGCIALVIIISMWYLFKKEITLTQRNFTKMNQIVNDVCLTMNRNSDHSLSEQEMNEILRKKR